MENVFRRYSGNVEIKMRYRPLMGGYECELHFPNPKENPSVYVNVGEPSCIEYAIDSKEALDATARAALSFGADDNRFCDSIEEHAELGEDSWVVSESKLHSR